MLDANYVREIIVDNEWVINLGEVDKKTGLFYKLKDNAPEDVKEKWKEFVSLMDSNG